MLDSNTPQTVLLVQTECERTHFVRARADVVATKLGIILSFSFFLFLFSFLPSTSKSSAGQRTGEKRRDTARRFVFFGWLWQAECMCYG